MVGPDRMAGDPQAGVVGKHLFPAVIGDLLSGRESPDGGRDLYVEMVRRVQRARCGQSLPQHVIPLPRGQRVDHKGAVDDVGEAQRRPSSRAARMSSMVRSAGSRSRATRAIPSAWVSAAASASTGSPRQPDSDWPSDLARSRRTASVAGSTSRTWTIPASVGSLITLVYPSFMHHA